MRWTERELEELKNMLASGEFTSELAVAIAFHEIHPERKVDAIRWQIKIHPEWQRNLKSKSSTKDKDGLVKEVKPSTLKLEEPVELTILPEVWQKPGVRVGAFSRIDWGSAGARAALLKLAFEKVFVPQGCHYIVLNGGLVNHRAIKEEFITPRLAPLTPRERRELRAQIEEEVLTEIAAKLYSIIPRIRKPEVSAQEGAELVKLYIMTSPIIDGTYGERVARILQEFRPEDVRLYKSGGDRTRLKGVGATQEEKRLGLEIAWINPKKHRLPGQYASTSPDKEVREVEATAMSWPFIWVSAGHGSSISVPRRGRRRPIISLPVLHIPLTRKPGEPAPALNQVGVRVIEVSPDGQEVLIQTWSFRDLIKDERKFITGIKSGASELHNKIVNALKEDIEGFGLHVGEISDRIDVPRKEVENAVKFLEEPQPLSRRTWPGLYRDERSGRYNFHRVWLQETLRYPWPYDSYRELRRLIFGCLHAGYNTTDYMFVRYKLPEIILKKKVDCVELVGDIIAGLKHHLIHKGQIIGNLNYTEQEIFAAELVGTVIYEVFKARFEENWQKSENKEKELDKIIADSLVLFLYIIGNHDAWQKELGFTPGVLFKSKLLELLTRNIEKFISEKDLCFRIDDIIRSKIIELPEYNPVFEFEGGIRTTLLHPGMARAQTLSLRMEQMMAFSETELTDGANFHESFNMEKGDPELGQRVGTQAGAMTPLTYFEFGKLKRVDFGPVYVGIRYKDGRIFMSEHQFFNQPILEHPISKDTDINNLKSRLKLLIADP